MPAATPFVRLTLPAALSAMSLLCLAAPARSLGAQTPVGPALATRAQLQATLAQVDGSRGGGRSGEGALVRARLERGDFLVGDRIVVRVEGEPELSDTFTVGAGSVLGLPRIGEVPLAGVLRAELQGQLSAAIARYVRSPVVRAQALIRILVEGEVARPGYYPVPPDLPLADVVTVAGGLTQRAHVGGMRVQRGPQQIWGGRPLEQALGRGATLDQLSLQAGDRVLVPGRGDFERTVRILGVLVSIPVAVFTLTRIF